MEFKIILEFNKSKKESDLVSKLLSNNIISKFVLFSSKLIFLDDIEICPVKNVDQVLKIALTKELKAVEWIDVESISKSKTGQKPATGSTH